jgi:endoglucanase
VLPELLNEPPLAQARWLTLRDRLAEIVGRRCPDHTLVWGPARYQGIWEILDTPPLADAKAIAAVHYYNPMAFTHQCENWDASPLARVHNLPFPATHDTPQVAALRSSLEAAGDRTSLDLLDGEFTHPWGYAAIAADFAGLARWSERHRCPVIVDEFGVLDFCVDATSRANWVRDVRRAAEANSIGWAYWELDQGFGFIKSRQSLDGFQDAMIAALLGGGEAAS